MWKLGSACEDVWDRIKELNVNVTNFEECREVLAKVTPSDADGIPMDVISLLSVSVCNGKLVEDTYAINRFSFEERRAFTDWLIDSGYVTCKAPEYRSELPELRKKIEGLCVRKHQLTCNMGNVLKDQNMTEFLGLESDSLAYNPEHSEEFNDVKQLLWLSMQECEDVGDMVDEEADANPVYMMNMDLFEHIRKMFPDYIKYLMLPNTAEYEQVSAELKSIQKKYDDAYTLINITLTDGRVMGFGDDLYLKFILQIN